MPHFRLSFFNTIFSIYPLLGRGCCTLKYIFAIDPPLCPLPRRGGCCTLMYMLATDPPLCPLPRRGGCCTLKYMLAIDPPLCPLPGRGGLLHSQVHICHSPTPLSPPEEGRLSQPQIHICHRPTPQSPPREGRLLQSLSQTLPLLGGVRGGATHQQHINNTPSNRQQNTIKQASSRDQLRHFFSICSVVLQSTTEEQLKNGLT